MELDKKLATREEIQKLAVATNALRPDWPVKSLVTYLVNNHENRAYKDLALALTWVATDPETQNPARLSEAGPWWLTSRTSTLRGTPRIGPEVGEERCRYAGHEHESATRCRLCAAERAAGDVPEERTTYVEPPAAIVEVANRHRVKAATRSVTSSRDFAQDQELRAPDNFNVVMCARVGCGGYFVKDADGAAAHQAVFGHAPELPVARPEPEASDDGE